MQRIVFLIYHGMGHFNACLKPAKTLRSQYEVIFSGHIYFEKYVEEQGFPFYALKSVPFGLGFEPWMNKIEKKKNIWWHSLKDRWRDRLYHDRKNELIKMLEETEPNYILIDSWQSTDFIVLYQHLKSRSIKVAFIQTMVSSVIERGLPPLNSLAQPGNRSEIENAHQHYYNQQFRKKLIGKLKFFGRVNDTLIKTKIRENHIPEKYLSNQLSLFSPGFSRVDEFILSPLEFDFPSAGAPHQHYIGFMTDNSRIEVTDTAYLKLDRAIRLKLKETEAALIYCSFGTVSYEDMRSVREFLKKLINIAKEQNCVLIISSNAIDQASTNDLPENVYVFKVVPQLQVLTLASVMITHGGLNS
ncbi:MAG: glycosyltransferase, partial [Bacteroidota bacterium]